MSWFMIKPELKRLNLRNPLHFLAVGFGSGLSPKAPGTMGTLAAMIQNRPRYWFCKCVGSMLSAAMLADLLFESAVEKSMAPP